MYIIGGNDMQNKGGCDPRVFSVNPHLELRMAALLLFRLFQQRRP